MVGLISWRGGKFHFLKCLVRVFEKENSHRVVRIQSSVLRGERMAGWCKVADGVGVVRNWVWCLEVLVPSRNPRRTEDGGEKQQVHWVNLWPNSGSFVLETWDYTSCFLYKLWSHLDFLGGLMKQIQEFYVQCFQIFAISHAEMGWTPACRDLFPCTDCCDFLDCVQLWGTRDLSVWWPSSVWTGFYCLTYSQLLWQ